MPPALPVLTMTEPENGMMKSLLTILLSVVILMPAKAQPVSVSQGYHTTGRGCQQALLLRMDFKDDRAISRLTFRLKDDTRRNTASVQLFACNADEFYAEDVATTEDHGGNGRTCLGRAKSAQTVTFTLPPSATPCQGGRLWLTACVKAKARLGQSIDAALTRIDYADGTTMEVPDSMGNPAGEARIFDTHSLAFIPTTDGCRFYRIPAMVVDAEGHLLIAADRRYDSNADLGNHRIDVAIRRSTDNGHTWTAQQLIAQGDEQSDACFGYGDPALAVTPTGRIICIMAAGRNNYFHGMRHMGITMSDDNGRTWLPVRELTAAAFRDDAHQLTDSLGFWSIFTTSGRGLTTTDGTILFTTNTLSRAGSYTSDCYILSSRDNGSSWQLAPTPAFTGGDESKLVQLDNDSLLISVRRPGARGFNTADAQARQWGQQWTNADISNGNACNADILRYAPGLLLHTYLKHPTDRANLMLAMSTDNGRSWRDIMNIQPGQAAYSTMVRLPNGDVAILFEDASYHAGNGYALTYVTITKKQLQKATKLNIRAF